MADQAGENTIMFTQAGSTQLISPVEGEHESWHAGDKGPAVHGMQDVAELRASGWYVPCGHGLHESDDEPAGQRYSPASQVDVH